MRKNMTESQSQQLPCRCVQKWKLGHRGWMTLGKRGGSGAWSVAQPLPSTGEELPPNSSQPLSFCLLFFVCVSSPLGTTQPARWLCVSHSQASRERILLVLPSHGLWAEPPGHIISFWPFRRFPPYLWISYDFLVLSLCWEWLQNLLPLGTACSMVLCVEWRDMY